MAYLDELGNRTPANESDLIDAGHSNALAAILTSLGYTYVHLESGSLMTDKAPLADFMFTFTPAGVLVGGGGDAGSQLLSRQFLRELTATTALLPVVGDRFLFDDRSPYTWWSPHRTLQMFDVLTEPIPADRPKFVFTHIVKPHTPATFDRYGNYVSGKTLHGLGGTAHDEFSSTHDLSVPNAYIGQLIYINSLVLKAVDGILRNSTNDPIIVIAADHGRGDEKKHYILAAFHLPNGGNSGLYPSISSVNHFRYILDFYFDLGLGLLEDRNIEHASDHYDFRTPAPSSRT